MGKIGHVIKGKIGRSDASMFDFAADISEIALSHGQKGKFRKMEVSGEGGTALPGSEGEPGTAARAARLKEAIRLVGNARDLTRLSGVAYGTVQNYAQGGEMKLSNAAAIARATGVRLEWLATGDGPMRDEAAHSSPTPSRPRTLFSQINADVLGDAYATAIKALRSHGHANPEPRRVMQVTVLIYDQLTSGADNGTGNAPQDFPATERNPLE